jgi:predicted MFS family arabinose efflux permease
MGKIPSLRFILCLCFVLSGAASVSYQTIWLRDAMTYFGVITPVISSVLSAFMLGLALGTLLSGAVTRRIGARGTGFLCGNGIVDCGFCIMRAGLFLAGI